MAQTTVEGAERLTCPHCGHVDDEAEELFLDKDTDEREVQCASCGEQYHAVRVIDVTYSSYTYDDKEQA